MIGINASTGKRLSGVDHLRQSIRDILTTRIGSRVMRREYGSNLPNLVDNPMNEVLKADLFAATAGALERWEPRVRLDAVYITGAGADGGIAITVEGRILLDNQPFKLEGIEIK